MATGAEVVQWARAAGWSGADLVTAVAVAKAESGWNPTAVNNSNRNGTSDYGLFQINSIHNPTAFERTDGAANARRAFRIWQGSGWRAWSAYNSGSYKRFMAEATTLTGSVDLTGITLQNTRGDQAIDLPTPIATVIGANPLSGIGDAVNVFIANAKLWVSTTTLALTGLALVIVGLAILARQRVETVARTVAAVK